MMDAELSRPILLIVQLRNSLLLLLAVQMNNNFFVFTRCFQYTLVYIFFGFVCYYDYYYIGIFYRFWKCRSRIGHDRPMMSIYNNLRSSFYT